MTSLARQLAKLKDAPSVAQGVERDYSSLLFEKSEAASLDREQAYKLGLAGLAQLKKLDPEIDSYEPELFDESVLNFNRSMISKDENTKVTASIEHMITILAPYFHHYACKQVLEWLIYRYQTHTFDAEFLATALLPFHDLNSYGRLGSILFLKKSDWTWLKEATKDGLPIPFNILVRQCLTSGGNMHLIGAVANFASHLAKTFDEETLQKNYQYYFTFFAKLVVNLFDDPANATDQLISRVLPHLGIALKSKALPFKLSGMVILVQLSMNVTFAAENLQPIISLLLNKINHRFFEPVMNTLIVVCQRQQLESLPEKSICRLVLKGDELGLLDYLESTMLKADLIGFLKPLWKTIFNVLAKGMYSENLEDFYAVLNTTTTASSLTGSQASVLINLVIEMIAKKELVKLPKVMQRNLKAVILRFASEFDVIHAKYLKSDEETIEILIDQCQLQPHEIGAIVIDVGKKRRRRQSSTRSQPESEPEEGIKPKVSKQQQLRNALGPEKRKPFNGPPTEILVKINEKKWEEAVFMLESFKIQKYRESYKQHDFEKFGLNLIAKVSTEKVSVTPEIKAALALIKFGTDFALKIVNRGVAEPQSKKTKVTESSILSDNPFSGESEETYNKRLTFALELLNANSTYKPDVKLFSVLFGLIEKLVSDDERSEQNSYNVSLIVALFLKYMKRPDIMQSMSSVFNFDAIAKVVRFTYDHNVLRNALQLLALLAPVIPGQVVTHIMSVFTFMGDGGILKKDNEMTLSIVEEALHALFMAIVKSEPSNTAGAQLKIRQRLLEVSRVFAVSLVDLPAHRRMRVLHAIANTMSPKDVWILLAAIYDNFCAKWQKSTSKKDTDLIHDITLEFMGEFEPEHQLSAAISLIDYILYLGPDVQTAGERAEGRNPKYEQLNIFDRDQRSIQKLRHFRFLIFSFVQKFLNYKPLYEQLGVLNDDEMYQRMVLVGKKILITVTNLGDFMDAQLQPFLKVEENNPEARYWTTLSAKADNIADRMRCLLPANVSGHIICDLLIDSDADGRTEVKVDSRIRDRAMQLLNIKLMAGVDGNIEGGDIHIEYLIKFAQKLNEWIRPAENRDDIVLCQNASFSLKLVAKRMPTNEGQKIFADTTERCIEILKQWNSLDEAMVGNILLLVGELVRSQNVKSITLHSDMLCNLCINVLKECDKRAADVIEQIETEKLPEPEPVPTGTRRRQRTQHSLCGKQYGDDVLLLCSLTCAQRLFDHAAKLMMNFYEPFLLVTNTLSSKYLGDCTERQDSQRLDNIRLRLNLIRSAIAKQELKSLIDPYKNVVNALLKKPVALSWLCGIITESLKLAKTDTVIDVVQGLIELFMMLFKFRKNERRPEKFAVVNYCEDSIVTAFLALIDHMRAENLKPIINALVDHLKSSLSDSESARNSRPMALTIFNFANQFYESYNTLAIPYFAQLFELSVTILKVLNAAKEPKESIYIDGREADSLGEVQADRLIVLLLNFITKCAKNHTFFTDDLAQICYGPVLDEIENVDVGGHEERCIPHLSNCVYAIAEASVELFNREICEKLLQKTRHTSSKVRYRAILVFDALVDRIADALAPLLPMIVQYLSELMEDPNTKVSTQCEKTIRQLRQKFGDEVLGNN